MPRDVPPKTTRLPTTWIPAPPLPAGPPAEVRLELRAALAEGDGLVSYWVADDRTLAWLIERDRASFVAIPVSRAELGAAVGRFLEPLHSRALATDAVLKSTEGEQLALGRPVPQNQVAGGNRHGLRRAHSQRSASTGSTRVAFNAGSQLDASAASARMPATAP
jgi:hypothetical protein